MKKQNKTKQNKTKQTKTKQNKTKQNVNLLVVALKADHFLTYLYQAECPWVIRCPIIFVTRPSQSHMTLTAGTHKPIIGLIMELLLNIC